MTDDTALKNEPFRLSDEQIAEILGKDRGWIRGAWPFTEVTAEMVEAARNIVVAEALRRLAEAERA